MLGIFGSVPAFDYLFCKGMGVYGFSEKSLFKVQIMYYEYKDHIINAVKDYNQKVIGKMDDKIYIVDFSTGKESKYYYTNAKLVDMIWWMEGFKIDKNLK